MRDGWNRATAVLDLSAEVVEALVCNAVPGAKVVRFQAVEGGLANTNIKVELVNPSGSTVLLKIFVREPETAPKEYALNQLVRERVLAPKFLYFSGRNIRTERSATTIPDRSIPSDISVLADRLICSDEPNSRSVEPNIGFPYAVIEWVDGVMLQSVFPNLSEEHRRNLGESVGSALAGIHSFKFPDFGFFDGDLKVKEPITMDGAGLVSYVRQCLVDGPGGKRIGAELTERLIEYLEREAKLLDSWKGEPCLTHADFNHSNILVAPRALDAAPPVRDSVLAKAATSARVSASANAPISADLAEFEVAAVLDWEFAFSGTPFFDFGNLLRAPVGTSKSFVDGVEYGYKRAGGILPVEWRKMSLLTDLTAWAEFMTRDVVNANLIADAVRVIERTIGS